MNSTVKPIYHNLYNQAIILSDGIVANNGNELSKIAMHLATDLVETHLVADLLDLKINLSGHLAGELDGLVLKDALTNKYGGRLFYDMKKKRINSIKHFIISRTIERLGDIIQNITYHTFKTLSFTDLAEELEHPVFCETVSCPYCGAESNVYRNGDTISLTSNYPDEDAMPEQQPCTQSKGVQDYKTTIEVNSGKLIFTNVFSDLFSKSIVNGSSDYLDDKTGYNNSINSHKGKILYTDYWALQGVAYIFSYNAASIFLNANNNEIQVKAESYDDETDDEIPNYTESEKNMGHISVAVWAICAMDYDKFLEKCKESNTDPQDFISEKDCIVVDVDKGTYEVLMLASGVSEFQDHHATFRKI